jgi:RNA polymerase sigma-70 factor (ECF subfamily)
VASGPGSREERLDALWITHAPAVMRYARRRVLNAEVDEVVAETFLVAWRRIDEVPSYALPWLLGVARGVSANVRRAARRRDALTERLTAAEQPPPVHQDLVHDGALATVAAALARLSDDDRELLTLIEWDGLTREQAAEAMRCSRSALAVRLHRARRRLRAKLIQPDELDPPPDAVPLSDGAEVTAR